MGISPYEEGFALTGQDPSCSKEGCFFFFLSLSSLYLILRMQAIMSQEKGASRTADLMPMRSGLAWGILGERPMTVGSSMTGTINGFKIAQRIHDCYEGTVKRHKILHIEKPPLEFEPTRASLFYEFQEEYVQHKMPSNYLHRTKAT